MTLWLDGTDSCAVRALTTTRADGDFSSRSEPDALAVRRRSLVDLPWAWVNQVHGSQVVVVTKRNIRGVSGRDADALVCAESDLVLSVATADCFPVVLHSDEGVISVAHAGWRGLLSGVVESAVEAMRALGATDICAEAGPVIGPECYSFGEADLATMVSRFGPGVQAYTSSGLPALDMRAALRVVIARSGLRVGRISEACTSCEGDLWFSHRARRDEGRMATIAWRSSYADASL